MEIETLLDNILKYLSKGEIKAKSNTKNHTKELTLKLLVEFNINDIEDLFDLLKILNEDGYIKHRKSLNCNNDSLGSSNYYLLKANITMKGKIFIYKGGYIQIEKNKKLTLLTQKTINFSLIFGGLSAGAYYMAKGCLWILHFFHK